MVFEVQSLSYWGKYSPEVKDTLDNDSDDGGLVALADFGILYIPQKLPDVHVVWWSRDDI